MIVGVGLDLADVARLGALRRRWGERLLRRVYTDAELEACLGRGDADDALAARFAAKEAAMKALGTGWSGGVTWRDVEVVSRRGTAPTLRLTGEAAALAARLGVQGVHLSLSHDKGVAAAVVILEA